MALSEYHQIRERTLAAGERFFPGSAGLGMDALRLESFNELPLRMYESERIYRIVHRPAFDSTTSFRIIPGDNISLFRVTPYVTEQFPLFDEYVTDLEAILMAIAECFEPPTENVGFCDADAFLFESFTFQTHRYFKRHVRKSDSKVLPLMQSLWSLLVASHPNRR